MIKYSNFKLWQKILLGILSLIIISLTAVFITVYIHLSSNIEHSTKEKLIAIKNLIAGILQFCPKRDGEGCTQKPGHDRVNKIHDADIFMVGRKQPAPPAMRCVVVVVVMGCSCAVGHKSLVLLDA